MKEIRVHKYIIAMIFMFILCFTIPTQSVYASSASITFKTNKSTYEKGDNIIVNLYVESEVEVGDFVAFISYNSDVLEFLPDASFIAGGEGLVKVSDNNVIEGSKTRKYAMAFKALEVGKSEIKLQEDPDIYDFSTGNNMSVSLNSIEVEVKAVATASNNADLKTLKINGVTLDKTFDKNTTEYNIEVESDVEKLIISAIPEDEKAGVSIEGNQAFVEGMNEVKIIVSAESKEIKKYKINVNKKKPVDIIDNTKEEDNKDTIDLNSFKAYQEESRTYVTYGYRYEILEPSTNVVIPEGYKAEYIRIGDITTLGYVSALEEEQDFYLLYAKNDFGAVGFYKYDRIEQTMQRYIPVEHIAVEEPVIENTEEASDNNMILLSIIGVLVVLLIGSSIFLAKLYLNKK